MYLFILRDKVFLKLTGIGFVIKRTYITIESDLVNLCTKIKSTVINTFVNVGQIKNNVKVGLIT